MAQPQTLAPMSFEGFEERYEPQYNVFAQKELSEQEDNGRTTIDDMRPFGGMMYETFGEELEYVKAQPNKRIWTIRDDEGLCITPGFGIVNRLGYIITTKDWEHEHELVDLEEE